jgi:hypothetical protein
MHLVREIATLSRFRLYKNSGVRLAKLGSAAGNVAYSAVSMAITRFEERLKVDRNLQRRIKAVRAILEL